MATAQHDDRERLEDLAFVGPRTAERLAAADVTAEDVRGKRVSYRDLVAAGVNPGVAAKLRREHSLHWTLDEQGADLDRRSEQVRGLRDGEREWIAAARSDDGNGRGDAGSPDTDRDDAEIRGDTGDDERSHGDWPAWPDDDADEVPQRS